MRASRRSLAIAASMILSAPALVAICRAEEPPGAGRRITVVASPAGLPLGGRCSVELNPQAKWFGTVQETFEGKVVAADDRSVTLSVDTFHRDAEAANLPLVGHLLKEKGVGRTRPGEEFELRIPAERIRSAPTFSGDAPADEKPGAGRRITVGASPAIIPPGTRCRVELSPEVDGSTTIETVHEGKVVAADDEGLTLSVSSIRRKDVYNAEAARLPLIGRLFTNVGIGRTKPGEEKYVRLPAEKIRTVELLQD